MSTPTLQEVLKALGDALQKPVPEQIAKAWVQPGTPTTGINAYDLEAPAKLLFPVLTPLRNTIPRVGGGVGTATNWKAVTGINTGLLEVGVSEGNRSGAIVHTTADFTAAYKGIGLEDYVTFEADYAAKSFDDAKALAVNGLLNSLMIGEEILLLGGNTSLQLGTTPTPTLAASTTGGTLATAAAFSVICVALSMAGWYASGGNPIGTAPVRASVTRVNTDASTDVYGGGSGQKSANATVSVTGATGSVTGTVTPVVGAFAYAWFWSAAAGSEILGAITNINSVSITALATGSQTAASLPSADNSTNGLVFDGLLTQCVKPASGGYVYTAVNGTAGIGKGLTADGAGGIVEFDALLKNRWDNFRLGVDEIWVNSQEQQRLQAIILSSPSTAAQRFVFNVTQGKIMGGSLALSYLNKFGMSGANGSSEYGQGTEIPIRIHPNMPPGTILFRTKALPYKLNNVPNIVQVKNRRDYYQIEWPLRSRKYEYGVYADEVLQNYFPAAFGVITNLGSG
jgi:hypothetical protein